MKRSKDLIYPKFPEMKKNKWGWYSVSDKDYKEFYNNKYEYLKQLNSNYIPAIKEKTLMFASYKNRYHQSYVFHKYIPECEGECIAVMEEK